MQNGQQIPLTEQSAYDFIDKIIYLEENLGKNTTFRMLSPAELAIKDPNGIAKSIANFIGLHTWFIVNRGAEQAAGTIEQEGAFSFIEINHEVCRSSEQLLAVLSHEIMHKYLRMHGLSYSSELENEILTDVATIYTGLGKLTLNGVYAEYMKYEGNTLVTSIQKIGYLTIESFCFIYLLLCKLRGLPVSTNELNDNVIAVLHEVENSQLYSDISLQIDDDENELLRIEDSFKAQHSKSEADIESKITYLEKTLSNLKGKQDGLQRLFSLTSKSIDHFGETTEYNPVLNKLKRTKQLKFLRLQLQKQQVMIETLLNEMSEIKMFFIKPNNKSTKKTKKLFEWLRKK